ncbi:MAG: hypothetical protein LAC70_07415 [Methylovulum sp.]|nr:hypothetical protein [Methylovulum sp.]
MATKKYQLFYDIAVVAHVVLGIEFVLGGFIDLGGHSELLSFFAAILSLFVLLPSIIFVVPTVIVLSLLLRDVRLVFLTLMLFFTIKFLFSEFERNSSLLIATPYALASLWCAFEWFSERRKMHSAT